jgi:hypothetical protein
MVGGIVKRFFSYGLMLCLSAGLALAETWNGTLRDAMCKSKDAVNHTRECALGCSKSGLGIITADGKFLPFDKAGNEKALAALKATKKEKDLRVKVTGKAQGNTIQVSSIEWQ